MNIPRKCDCGCEETYKKVQTTENIDGKETVTEYSLHCSNCDRYLGSFSYGHWEY